MGEDRALWLGRKEYTDILKLQNTIFEAISAGKQNDTLLFVEHNPIYTLGRSIFSKGILNKEEYLCVDRGGGLTYHGPGQLVCYPLVHLGRESADLKLYLKKLEDVVIRTLSSIAIYGYRINGATGVWACGKKISSIGVKVVRGFTKHGFSINIAPDLNYFREINPCGLDGSVVSSLKELTGRSIDMVGLAPKVTECFNEVFSRNFNFINNA